MRYYQSIVVGGGLAGLRAAIELNRNNIPAAVISRVHPVRSHSIAAQGGINAALNNHERGVYDSVEKHAFDTVKGSDYLADQDAVFKMCSEGPERIYEMEHWGCPFSRNPEGRIAQRPFGGAGFPRTCFAADKTGHVLLHTLWEQVVRFMQASERGEMQLLDEWVVLRIISDGTRCRGVAAMDLRTGAIEAILADAVIFATGGSGRIYGNSTNALISTAHGAAVAYWAGVPLKDMEFIQFHPTTLVGTNILMTEGCRGEGGFLRNKDGDRFMAFYDDSKKAMEVAPRDITSRNIMREILAGRGFPGGYVHLDITHLGEAKIMERLPGIRDLCVNFAGVDPVRAPIPVQPGQHYTMGGIDTDHTGATEMKGLYAAGECACVSVHGANRLGGNSLLETIVYGSIAGRAAAEYIASLAATGPDQKLAELALADAEAEVARIMASSGSEPVGAIREELAAHMADDAGVFRDEPALANALEEVRMLRERMKRASAGGSPSKSYNFALINYLETAANIDVAEALVSGAILRKESRGSHFRTDYPKRDDENFLRHTVARYSPDGVKISYKPVTLGRWAPKERKY